MPQHKSEESWQIAKKLAGSISTMPDQVSYAIKVLLTEHCKRAASTLDGAKGNDDTADINKRAYSAVRSIDRFASIKAPLYFASYTLYPDRFSVAEDDSAKALLRILGPGLFAALLSQVWYFRRCEKLCAESIQEYITSNFVLTLELGFRCGEALPALGPGVGALIGGIRYAGLAALAIKDTDNYQRYVNSRGNQLDAEFEHSRWQADHAQVSFGLLQTIGGMQWAGQASSSSFYPHQVRKALLGEVSSDEEVPDILRLWSDVIRTIEAFKNGKYSVKFLESYVANQVQLEDLSSTLKDTIRTSAANFQWIKRKKLRLTEDEEIPVPGQSEDED